ncbi:MAG: hypothetical protein H6686_01285 [Fibrobacteria bacterium]|nr:hypothetical protein [Fibrobacteria bacterium]
MKRIALLLAGATGLAMASRPLPGANLLGINAGVVSDWDGSNAFADIMVHARAWADAPWTGNVAVDADAWPLADASTVVFGDGNDTGAYHLTFEGQAESVSLMWAEGSVDSLRWDASTNRSTAVVHLTGLPNGAGGLRLEGTRRTPASPVGSGFRDAHLWRPGVPTDGSVLFTDGFLSMTRPFHVVRFMDWGLTNINPVRTWVQRRGPFQANRGNPTIDGISDGDLGMPVEYMVALANAARTDMWINIPVRADSDFVARTVRAIRFGTDGRNPYNGPVADPVFPPLDPDLSVYVEFANELWNSAGGFRAGAWLNDEYVAQVQGHSEHPVFWDGITDAWVPWFRYWAWKAAWMARTVRASCGSGEFLARFRPVIGGQLSSEWAFQLGLNFVEHRVEPVRNLFWGGGGTAYWGPDAWSADPSVFFAPGNNPHREWVDWLETDAVLVGAFGLRRIAYEGGLGMDWSGPSLNEAAKWNLLSDDRMRTTMENVHDVWSRAGGGLLTYFSLANHPDFAFSDSWKNDDSPKMRAVKELAARPSAPVSLGCTAPCTTYVARKDWGVGMVKLSWIGVDPQGDSTIVGMSEGDWRAFPVTIPEEGEWLVSLRTAAGGPLTGRILVQGIPLDTFSFDAGTEGALVTLPPTSVHLPAGLAVVRLEGLEGGDFQPNSIRVVRAQGPVSADRDHAIPPAEGSGLSSIEQIRWRLHRGRNYGMDGRQVPSAH